VLLVGLTGGIGSGKSSVANMLGEHGAVVFDADRLAREAVELGTRGYVAVVELFGSDVLLPGGELELKARLPFARSEYRRGNCVAIVAQELRSWDEADLCFREFRLKPFQHRNGVGRNSVVVSQ
jgi:hypothetical protein